ncbi:site-specific DNA-methyltransferase [Paracoccus sp. T5]
MQWLTGDADRRAAARVPFRLLTEQPDLSYGQGENGLLVQGDNLEALKALLPFYAGRVKCIYIDPPYNTRSAFEHYDDILEHAQWLGMIVPRLMLLREFLSEDRSIWVSIDDNEGHYLKVVMDEIFRRRNFVANVTWQKPYAPANDATWLSESHDQILAFALRKPEFITNNVPRSEQSLSVYKNPDDDPQGLWRSDTYTCAKSAAERPNLYYPIVQPFTGKEIWPKQTRVWRGDRGAAAIRRSRRRAPARRHRQSDGAVRLDAL